MAAAPVLALRGAMVSFGGLPLFDGVDLPLAPGDRACLVGRNGSGKSTLLKALAGEIELDGGERFVQPGTRVAYLPQEPRFGAHDTVADYVAAGLPADAGAAGPARAATVLDRVGLKGSQRTADLSGGEARRADLARALVAEPDVLLLDEPTNHLDLPTIEWLEAELGRFRGAILAISHDRTFLKSLSRSTMWLDRGILRRLDKGFAGFEGWAEGILQVEAQETAKQEKRIASEMIWLRQGISARRTRNEGRLRALMAMRKAAAERIAAPGRVKLEVAATDSGGSLVSEAERITKSYDGRTLVKDFSTRIARGARVGIIGPNGAGKTTLLRMLTGDLKPDSGRVRLGIGLEPVYFDQRRAALDPDASLWKTLAGSGDKVFVAGRPKHVVSYLRDYLFADAQANGPVSALSGGERSRLLLAKLFAQPSNLVILDEPTNDLDMDTLDLLEDVLADYAGTVLLVSHDRDFLDRVVTSTIVLEGDGTAIEYAGGYTDYLAQRRPPAAAPAAAKPAAKPAAAPASAAARTKLSYKDQRERDQLPERMTELESEIAGIEAVLADAAAYDKDPAGFGRKAERLEAARSELAAAEERWLELELAAEEAAKARAP